jgi:cell division protein FtsZ
MTIKLRAPEISELKPRITVLGVGGAGGNAVNNMIGAHLEGVSFVVANTDAQALALSKADHKIQLGAQLTEGLGAGAKPDIGRGAAEESLAEILEHLSGAHMVFITAGMGGGTGTGAAPVIARAVREQGILTVGVVTKPFHFEGDRRMKVAERGIEEMQNYVDTLIVIPNQNLFRVANERTTFAQAFSMADDVLHSGVRGVTDLIVMPGLINRDFADIKTVMSEMGKAMMGTGEAEGEGRALRAAESAISNPLLDDVSMKGARAVLINVTGGPDLMLFEVDEAVNRVRAEVDPDANILFGSALSEDMEGRVRVSVVATGIDAEAMTKGKGAPDNVQKFPRRRAVEAEAPMPLPRAVADSLTPAPSPVHRHMETLSNGFAPAAEAAPVEMYVQPQAPVMQPAPMALGGSDAPALEDGHGGMHSMRDIAHAAPLPEKRGVFGLFGGRRKPERPSHMMEPPMETPVRAMPPQKATTQAIGRAQGPQPQTHAAPAPRANAESPRPQSTEDLFANAKDEERFEIPAFLRRQANTGT